MENNQKSEQKRLEVLNSYQILDSTPEDVFEDIVHLAKLIFDVPIALVSLVDSERQWFKARVGIEVCETNRKVSFCQYTMCQEYPMVINDALSNEQFRNNDLVTGSPGIRFYAGAPLISPDGYGLGSICIIDLIPRELNEKQIQILMNLGNQVVNLMEYRRIALSSS